MNSPLSFRVRGSVRVLLLAVAGAIAGSMMAAASSPAPQVQRIAKPNQPGMATAVRVADVPLVYTGQIFGADDAGDASRQAERALRALEATLARAGSDLKRVVRLSAYVADDRAVGPVEAAVAQRFADAPVACTIVRTPLAVPTALVAFEAVAMSSRTPSAVEVMDGVGAVLPAGGKIFISGQAARGPDLAAAVKATMAGLHRSVEHLGLGKSDIVQIKGFIQPMREHASARREVAASFDGAPVPPTILYEWVSDLFAEIEIVVSAKSLAAQPQNREPIAYAWLPWLTQSPRFCHVAHVMPGTPLIFVGAVEGGDASDPRTQMKAIFERLGSTLFEAGSSYRNLAKATYYLVDPTARTLLGDLRGVYFDPTRPPAASALNMTGLGYTGRAAMFDLIAVPVK